MDEIAMFVFEDIPLHITLSNIVKPKYFHVDDKRKLPIRYANKIGEYYDWSKDGYLYDIDTKDFIVSNPQDVGKPNGIRINGNILWEIATSDERSIKKSIARSAIVHTIKRKLVKYFIDELAKQSIPSEFKTPITINMVMECDLALDVDNQETFYKKAFLDSIQSKVWIYDGKTSKSVDNKVGFIFDDSPKYVNSVAFSITKGETNRLTVIIYESYN